MKTTDWLVSNSAGVPAQLAANINRIVGDSTSSPDAFLTSGTQVLRQLIKQGATDRSAALDLLTADALVTYAFEIGAQPWVVSPSDGLTLVAQPSEGDTTQGFINLERLARKAMCDIAEISK